MEMPMKQTPFDDASVLALTKEGERELREPGTLLSPAQLEVLVLIGGGATVAQALKRAPEVGQAGLRAALRELVAKNLVSVDAALAPDIIDPGDFFTAGAAREPSAEESAQAAAEVDADAAFLQRNGYYVNMARRRTGKIQPVGHKSSVLVVEDDPDISKLVQICLKLEGLDTRKAANREEIVAALRTPPLPDLVLLDVRLTDINGFDVLARMRQHEVLSLVPVVMLTAEATRDAVLKGILGGADGFVTKPFQIDRLVSAVKTVLGLK